METKIKPTEFKGSLMCRPLSCGLGVVCMSVRIQYGVEPTKGTFVDSQYAFNLYDLLKTKICAFYLLCNALYHYVFILGMNEW